MELVGRRLKDENSITGASTPSKIPKADHAVPRARPAVGSRLAGTETCDISDFTYSNEWLLRITGNARVHGDRLEKAFHNAAPGAINRSFTGHVYNQSPNLVASSLGWSIPGDPRWHEAWYHNPPCCTGNQARLLPNYIHHMWYGTPAGGLAATMFGPNRVRAPVGASGTVVTIETDTAYPFEDNIRMTVSVPGSDGVTFPLLLRIPGWCKAPTITVAGKAVSASANPAGFATISRAWKDGDVVAISFPAELTASVRKTFADGTVNKTLDPRHPWMGSNATSNLPFCVIERGSLTFAYPMETDPKGEYGYAVDCDASTMTVNPGAMPKDVAWDWPLAAPMSVTIKARPFDWPDAWLLPAKPIAAAQTTGPEQTLTLIPYGNAKVFHISMFPVLKGK